MNNGSALRSEKSVTFLTNKIRDNNRAQSLTSLMNELDDRGYCVNLITVEKRTPFDFAYHSTIKRFVINDPYLSHMNLTEKFDNILSQIDSSVFIFWGNIYQNTFKHINQLLNRDLKVILAQQESQFIHLQKGSAIFQSRVNRILPQLFAVVSISEVDTLCNKMTKLRNAQTIPFLFPFKCGDYKSAHLNMNDVAVILPNTISSVDKAFPVLDAFNTYDNSRNFNLHLVPLNMDFDKEQLAKIDTYLAENKISCTVENKIEKLKNLTFSPAYCIFSSFAENLPEISIEAVASRIPSVICKNYNYSADNGLNAMKFADMNNTAQLVEILKKWETVEARKEYRKVINNCICDAARNKTIEKWEKLIASDESLPTCEATTCEATIVQLLQDSYNNIIARNENVIANRSKFLFRLSGKYYRIKNKILKSPGIFCRIIRSPYSILRRIIKSIYSAEQKRTAEFQYINISNEQVEKLQLIAYKLLLEFDRICKKYDINYYIAAGTLLGGIRHKGFIPWDDDIDVTLPRPDYDKFLEVVKKELGDEFSFRMDCSPYAFHRIELKGTRITRSLQRKGHGVFIDLFPLDGAAPTPKEQDKHGKTNKRLTEMMWAKGRMIPAFRFSRKVIRVIMIRCFLKIFVPRKLLRVAWDKNAKKYDCESAEKWVCLAGLYGYEKECFPKEYWGTPVPLEFEGKIFPTMSHWNDYLTSHYGNYMQLLPETQRRTHNMFSCDLGRYEAMSVEEIKEEVMGGISDDLRCGVSGGTRHENELSNT